MSQPSGARPIVIGVGELLWDCFAEGRRPGGAPANVAYHAQQLGFAGIACTRVGQDADGNALVEYLSSRGLDTACIQRDTEHPTGTVTVHMDESNQPSYIIHEDVAWDYLEDDGAWRSVFGQAAAICFGTLAQRSLTSRKTIQASLDRSGHALRVYDVNLRPPFFDADLIRTSMERADVLKFNHEEAPTLASLLGIEAEGLVGVARALCDSFDVRAVAITRGAGGCLLVVGDEMADVPGKAVRVADPVGAGDAFTAALTVGLLQGWPAEKVARFANEVGGLVASREGAMPDVTDAYAELMSRFGDGAR